MKKILTAGLAGAWAGCALGAAGAEATEAADAGKAEAARRGAREEFAAGEAAYGKGEYAAAAAAFLRAAEGAGEEGLDGDVARFNALVAAERGGEIPLEVLEGVPSTSDVDLQAQLYFNRGNAWRRKADAARAVAGEDSGAGLEEMKNAMVEYQAAVLRDPANAMYVANCELGQQYLNTILAEVQKKESEVPKEESEHLEEGDDEKVGDKDGEDEGWHKDPEGDTSMEDPEGDASMEDPEGDELTQGESLQAREGEPQEEMEEREAAALMDLMKDKEQAQREKLRVRLGRPVPVEKDW